MLEARVLGIIREIAKDNSIRSDTALQDLSSWDSMMFAECLVRIESELGLELNLESEIVVAGDFVEIALEASRRAC